MMPLEGNIMTSAAAAAEAPGPAPAFGGLPDDIVEELATLIGRRLSVYAEARLSSMAEDHGLPLLDLRALAFIMEFESLSTGQLGQLMDLSYGGVTALINRLEAGGYIHRDRNLLDRRMVTLRAVPERCSDMVFPEQYLVRRLAEVAQRSSKSELIGAFDFLGRCVKALRRDVLLRLGEGA